MALPIDLTKDALLQFFFIFFDIYGAYSAFSVGIIKNPFSLFVCLTNMALCLLDALLLLVEPPFKIEVSFIDNFIDRSALYIMVSLLFYTKYTIKNYIWRIFGIGAIVSFLLSFSSIENFVPLFSQCKVQLKENYDFLNRYGKEQDEAYSPLNPSSV